MTNIGGRMERARNQRLLTNRSKLHLNVLTRFERSEFLSQKRLQRFKRCVAGLTCVPARRRRPAPAEESAAVRGTGRNVIERLTNV
eukprot:6190401-Pleurochrysis_carterae.AAC.3